MLNKSDIALMRGMVTEVLHVELEKELRQQDVRFDQKLHDLRLDIRDEIYFCIAASEVRTMKKMETMKEEIIADLRADVDRVTVRLQMA